MASRRVEDRHKRAVDRILSATGMVCIRSPPHSEEHTTESQASEEAVDTEAEEERSFQSSPVTESFNELVEEIPEEENAIFPSPSLRHILPDKLRKIEAQNRIHVLPKEFKTHIDPALIPKIVPHVKYIDIIGYLVGCTEYKSSLAEFWFLDTMANLLRRAQDDLLPRNSQAVLMLWFCEWMKEIQNFDAADRKRMLRRFKDNMLSAARFVARDLRLPTPDEAGVCYYAVDEELVHELKEPKPDEHKKEPKPDEHKKELKPGEHKKELKPDDPHLVQFQDCAYECAMKDLVKIMHYIFDLFSTDYQFDLVRSIFTFTPEYNLIEMPYPLQNPKKLYAALKGKKDKAKKEPKKDKDKPGKGKKKEPDTEEYIALMELKAKEERELDELELLDAEKWNMRSSILPLGFAGTDELFDKYWPPPPPEPEPEPQEVKPEKGKKKK